MARSRLELQKIFENILGSRNVYFQPPETVKLKYPCIIYTRSNIDINHADNIPYSKNKIYTVIVIDKNPDSTIPDKIADLESCSFERHYTSDNLNHDVFRLYF